MKKILFILGIVVLSAALVGIVMKAQAKHDSAENLALVAAQGGPAVSTGVDTTGKPSQVEGGGIQSLSDSYVALDPSVGGSGCFMPRVAQTFCFRAESFTTDYEYVYNLWQRFPTDWTVNNVYVQGSPSCTGAGTWGTFGWSYQTNPYEINVAHTRYQSTTDHCTAYYCFDVVSGTGSPDALESWYWDGDNYGNPPHHPCSNDGYTPSGQIACDQAVNPQALIPPCAVGLSLEPETVTSEGCSGEPQVHTFSLLNNTGSDAIFDLTYAVPTANATLIGPSSISVLYGATRSFNVTLTPDVCAPVGTAVSGVVEASGNGYSDQSTINKTIVDVTGWEAIPASAPTWGGTGYPQDGCTTRNAAGQWVTYLIGDTSGTGPVGFWGYNHATNIWFQPAASNTPPDRWAPDWAYDETTNLCYLTGGANTPGGGTYAETYRFNPVANTFTQLGSFTSVRDFHNSWVGVIDSVKVLCIGGGIDSSSNRPQTTQCYDLNQAAPGVWNAENAQMAAFPTDPFGAADGVLHAPTGDQFWYVAGATSSGVTDEARFWDDADNSWHFAGNTGVPRYRVEGDFFRGDFYQLGGSSGGFTPTSNVVRGRFDGVNWVWNPLPPLHNVRMDNIVAVTGDTIWSVAGYGSSNPAYVERLEFCQTCYEWGKTINGIPWQPSIQVTVQTSDTVVVQEVLQLNPMPLALSGSMPFEPVNVDSKGSNPALMVSSPTRSLGLPEPPANPDAVLWDQPLSTVNQAAYVDQDFPDYTAYTSFLSDDFINNQPWNISTIFIPGDGWNGFTTLMNATALTWQIYADGAGIPNGDPAGGGSPPVWTLTLPPTDLQVILSAGIPGGYLSNATLILASPITLPPGHWWLVFYPTLSFGSYGQYGRQPADTTNGYTGQFINPGGGFGLGTAWQNWTVLGAAQPDIAFRLEGTVQPVIYTQTENWDPARLHLLDWAATGGSVIIDPSGQVTWTGEIFPSNTITLTKWFHVEPCNWQSTVLVEDLWLNQYELEQRPVTIEKIPPELWIDALYAPPVAAGLPAGFILVYGNSGGLETSAIIRNDFPPTAPFMESNPAPDRVGPNGSWAEWDIGPLPMGARDFINVNVLIQAGLPISTNITIWDGIFDHVGVLRDSVNFVFHVEPGPVTWDKTINGIPWEPGIHFTVQASDTVTVQEVLHLNPMPLAASTPFVPVNVEGKGSNPALMVSSSAKSVGVPEPPANPDAVLWDQPLSTVNQAAYVDQDFPDYTAYTSFLSDDFINTQPWNISTIFIPGNGWSGFSSLYNATALTWQIYADNAGVPAGNPSGGGSPPVWTLTLPPGDPHIILSAGTPGGYLSNATLLLVPPLTLPPGHWWLVFYPTLSFGSYGQYGRQPANTTNGYTGQFINPGGGFGYGTVWQNWTVLGPAQPDIAFRLEGAVAQPMNYFLYETYDPTRLHLVDWASTAGNVIIDPSGQVVWTGEIVTPANITLTKWFHVEAGNWRETLLWEELWLNQFILGQRGVNLIKRLFFLPVIINAP